MQHDKYDRNHARVHLAAHADEAANGALASRLDLASIGAALYGVGWRAVLAQELGLASEAEICQIETSRAPLPPWLREALIGIAQQRAANALDIAGRLALEVGLLTSGWVTKRGLNLGDHSVAA